MAGPDHTDVLNVKQLSAKQREMVASLAERFGAIDGMRAVGLAGSYARGHTQPGSDIDLGLLYSETAPFSIASVRELAEAVNDTAGLVVTDFYEWGPWVGYEPRPISCRRQSTRSRLGTSRPCRQRSSPRGKGTRRSYQLLGDSSSSSRDSTGTATKSDH